MAALGTATRYVILIGLLAFLVLCMMPNLWSYAIGVTLFTPIVAAGVAGIELMVHKKTQAGMAMLGAVALVVAALVFGVSS